MGSPKPLSSLVCFLWSLLYVQLVTDAPNRMNPTGGLKRKSEFFPERHHVSVNCVNRDAVFLPPNLGQKFYAGKHSSGFTSKRPEERRTLRGQSDSMATNADAVVVAVQADPSE
jgi:hypothetical protein